MDANKHTTGLWRYAPTGPTMQSYSQPYCVTGTDENRAKIVCGCFGDIGGEEVAKSNAEFIVRACNSFDRLVNALRAYMAFDEAQSNGDATRRSLVYTQGYQALEHAGALAKASQSMPHIEP